MPETLRLSGGSSPIRERRGRGSRAVPFLEEMEEREQILEILNDQHEH